MSEKPELSEYFQKIPDFLLKVQIIGQPKEYNKDRLESKTPPSLSKNHYFTYYRCFHRLPQGVPGKTAAALVTSTNVRTGNKDIPLSRKERLP